MLKQFRYNHPTVFIILAAGLAALYVLVMSKLFGNEAEILWLRVTFAAAFVFLYNDILETSFIAREKATAKNRDFWIFGFYAGYSFSLLMLLTFWRDVEHLAQHMFTFVVVTISFGIGQAFFHPRDVSDSLQNKYILADGLITIPSFGRFLYYLVPFILLGFMFYYINSPPPITGWRPEYILFQFIFLGSIMQAYPLKYEDKRWSAHHFKLMLPKLTGIALLLYGLFYL